MRHRVARLLLIVAAFLLPLQAVAGIVMQLGQGDMRAGMAAESVEHCPFHEADGAPAQPDQAAGDTACDNCGVCHLACAGYIPAAEIRTSAVPSGGDYPAGTTTAMPSRSPEPPQHPPKHSA